MYYYPIIIRHVEHQNQNQRSGLCWLNWQNKILQELSQIYMRQCDLIQSDSSQLDMILVDFCCCKSIQLNVNFALNFFNLKTFLTPIVFENIVAEKVMT